MSKIICSLSVVLTVIFTAGLLSATSQEEQAAEPVHVETGTYKIMQKIGQDTIPQEIGTETYTKTTYSNNTIIYQGDAEFDFTVISTASGKIKTVSRLEIEEDSYFPRRYHMIRTSKGSEMETTIEMVSNIAIITKRINDKTDKADLPISTGAMFIEGNFVHHRALLLHRFTSSLPGKQNIIIVDPQLKRESTAILEFVGEEDVEIDGAMRMLKLYKVSIEKLAEMKLYVDDKGIVVKASNGAQDFILTSFEEKTGENPAGG
jgi:hypothetical protein